MDGKQTPSEEPTWQFKPGETISPRTEEAAPVSTPVTPTAQQQVATPPTPAAAPAEPTTPVAQPEPTPSEPAPVAVNEIPQPMPPAENFNENATGDGLTWSASEFIVHEKTAGWHFGLIAVSILAAVVFWFITKDIVTSIVVIVAGGMLSLYGARRPGELQYQLDNYGIGIGSKHFNFSDFRAFSVVPEGAFASIALLPTKRFALMTTLYFAPEDGDAIIEILGNHLPQQPTKADPIDSLMRKIRF